MLWLFTMKLNKYTSKNLFLQAAETFFTVFLIIFAAKSQIFHPKADDGSRFYHRVLL